MHAILVSIGTDGDILPYLGLGITLRSRGHRVTLAANEHFRSIATAQSLEFVPLISEEEHHDFLSNPDLWHPVKAARAAARWGVRLIERQYQLLAERASDDTVLLISSPGVLASGLDRSRGRAGS